MTTSFGWAILNRFFNWFMMMIGHIHDEQTKHILQASKVSAFKRDGVHGALSKVQSAVSTTHWIQSISFINSIL